MPVDAAVMHIPGVATKTLRLIVTGFGRFHNVESNPSSEIVRRLPAHLAVRREQPGALDGVTLERADVLDVAGSVVKGFLARCSIQSEREDENEPSRVLYLHIGVDESAPRFRLEKRAVNEAHYRCADELGWQPCHEKVELEGPEYRYTGLPVELLADRLRQAGHDCEVSLDAGMFVCNTTYYLSLGLAAKKQKETDVLFLHVPAAEKIPTDTQTKFVVALVETIAGLNRL